jgi:hypothetical protein
MIEGQVAYAEKVEREKAKLAALAAVREQAYRGVKDAALQVGAAQTDLLEVLWRSVADHLSMEPTIKVVWFARDSMASDFIRNNGARAYALMSERKIVTPAIVDADAGLTAFHEIGHHRDPFRGDALGMELGAWAWALASAPFWDRQFHERMTRDLAANVRQANTGKGEALNVGIHVIAIEELISEQSFQKAHRPAEAAIRALRVRQFQASVGGSQPCQRQRLCSDDGLASVRYRGQFLCRRCHETIVSDQHVADVRRWQKVEQIARAR